MARVKKAEVSTEGNVITWTFAEGAGELTLDLNDVPDGQKFNALLHGLRQKISDSYAGIPTPAEALERAKSVVEAILSDQWTTRTPGEGGTRVTQLAQALATVAGRSVEEASEVIAGLDAEGKKALQDNPQIALELANIKRKAAEAAAAKAAENAEGADAADLGAMFNG